MQFLDEFRRRWMRAIFLLKTACLDTKVLRELARHQRDEVARVWFEVVKESNPYELALGKSREGDVLDPFFGGDSRKTRIPNLDRRQVIHVGAPPQFGLALR